MKRKIIYLFSALLLFFVSPLYADRITGQPGGQLTTGENAWEVWEDNGDLVPGKDSTSDLGSSTSQVAIAYIDTLTMTNDIDADYIGNSAKRIYFTTNDFIINTPTVLSTATTPGFETVNGMPAITYADGETTPVHITFVVPDGYSSGGTLNVICGNESSGTNYLAWGVYINTNGGTWDTTVWNGTPVKVEGTSTTDVVTISATPFTSGLTAGDIVTVDIWRWDGSVGGEATLTDDLNIYGAYFE